MEMDDLDQMSDDVLRMRLLQYGFPNLPITETTRQTLIKKLRNIIKKTDNGELRHPSSNQAKYSSAGSEYKNTDTSVGSTKIPTPQTSFKIWLEDHCENLNLWVLFIIWTMCFYVIWRKDGEFQTYVLISGILGSVGILAYLKYLFDKFVDQVKSLNLWIIFIILTMCGYFSWTCGPGEGKENRELEAPNKMLNPPMIQMK